MKKQTITLDRRLLTGTVASSSPFDYELSGACSRLPFFRSTTLKSHYRAWANQAYGVALQSRASDWRYL
jgi:hypothetical protein